MAIRGRQQISNSTRRKQVIVQSSFKTALAVGFFQMLSSSNSDRPRFPKVIYEK
jgi:hypothetical protein